VPIIIIIYSFNVKLTSAALKVGEITAYITTSSTPSAYRVDPQPAENSPYPPKLYSPPKIRRKKFGLAGYQPNFDEELAAEKIPAKIRLIIKNFCKTFCIISLSRYPHNRMSP